MDLKSAIILMMCSFLLQMIVDISIVMAQSKKKSLIIVKSEPSGAMVYVKGENSYVGVTPFKLKSNFRGIYEIISFKKGYEKQKHIYLFNGNERGILRLKLIPKTQLKAGIRSFIFPGWGQFYSERKTSGMLISLLQFGTIISMVKYVKDYDKAVDEYEKALTIYEKNKKTYNLRDTYWNIVVDKHNRADDIYNKRQIWMTITCGLWIYNILDAIFFFPSFEKDIFNRSLPNISTNIQNGTASLILTMSF